jgi:hypothetical protein
LLRPAVDYHREQHGLVALANRFTEDGSQVMLAVVPRPRTTYRPIHHRCVKSPGQRAARDPDPGLVRTAGR